MGSLSHRCGVLKRRICIFHIYCIFTVRDPLKTLRADLSRNISRRWSRFVMYALETPKNKSHLIGFTTPLGHRWKLHWSPRWLIGLQQPFIPCLYMLHRCEGLLCLISHWIHLISLLIWLNSLDDANPKWDWIRSNELNLISKAIELFNYYCNVNIKKKTQLKSEIQKKPSLQNQFESWVTSLNQSLYRIY